MPNNGTDHRVRRIDFQLETAACRTSRASDGYPPVRGIWMRRGQTENASEAAAQIVACSQNANQRLRPHIWQRIRRGVSSIDVTIQNGIHNPPETNVKRQFVAKLVRSRSCTVIDSQRKQNAFLFTIAIRFHVVLSDNDRDHRVRTVDLPFQNARKPDFGASHWLSPIYEMYD